VVGVINLANLYGNYRRTPRAHRPDFLQVSVRMALAQHRELPDEFAAASPDLRPRLWARLDRSAPSCESRPVLTGGRRSG
jgi:hypothetical protein